jgi:hypothetical protein
VSSTLNEERVPSPSDAAASPDGTRLAPHAQPAWIAAELPQEYADIARQIEDLRQRARSFERRADVLWCVGDPLRAAVREVFEALDCTTVTTAAGCSYDLAVDLGNGQRLLVEVIGGTAPFDKRAKEIGRALRAIQEDAGAGDRVVFVANIPCDKPIQQRHDPPATPDALRLIQGLGANVIASHTLFGLWRFSLKDMTSAKQSLRMLHALDGGIFR